MFWCIFLLIAFTVSCSFSFQVSSIPSLKCRNILNRSNSKQYARKKVGGQSEKIHFTSPFDPKASKKLQNPESNETLELTEENVEKVLAEVRPMLQGDGGDVKLSGIDGNVVKIELCGNCLSCSSSSMTLKMGIEQRMKQRIPTVREVVQMMPDAPEVNEENVEVVLSGVRPFLSFAGGSIRAEKVLRMGNGLPSVIVLKMEGSSKALHSVKLEIVKRIQKHFKQPLNIQWED